jgi:anti-sigma regulatory factor (Ser/Thr protein kinase)
MTVSTLPSPAARQCPDPPTCAHHQRHAFTVVPNEPFSVRLARHQARDVLTGWGIDAATTELAEQIVSELATNVVTHTHSCCLILRLRRVGEHSIEVAVTDHDTTTPTCFGARRARDDDEDGRGLYLVGELATRWGISSDTTQTTVWATIATSGTSA